MKNWFLNNFYPIFKKLEIYSDLFWKFGEKARTSKKYACEGVNEFIKKGDEKSIKTGNLIQNFHKSWGNIFIFRGQIN